MECVFTTVRLRRNTLAKYLQQQAVNARRSANHADAMLTRQRANFISPWQIGIHQYGHNIEISIFGMPRGGVDHVARPFAVGISHRNRYAATPRDVEAL